MPTAYEGHLGASGVQSEPSRASVGRVKVKFSAPSERDRVGVDRTGRLPLVHDFAWTGDPEYVKYENTFHYDEWAGSTRDFHASRRAADAKPAIWHSPRIRRRRRQWSMLFDAACTALFFYGLWFGEYPYEHITVVDPAWGGGAASGMEYPTLFTAGTRKHTFPEMLSPESVTVHECGHQFWYGLVGNNEFSGLARRGFNIHADEAAVVALRPRIRRRISGRVRRRRDRSAPRGTRAGCRDSASTCRAIVEPEPRLSIGGATSRCSFPRAHDPRDTDRIGYLVDPTRIRRQAGVLVRRPHEHARTATGARRRRCAARRSRRQRQLPARHAQLRGEVALPPSVSADFFDSFQEGAKVDMAGTSSRRPSTATLDWRVEVSQKELADPRGWFPASDGSWVEKTPAEHVDADKGAKEWMVDVIVRRRGDLLLPLTIELTWADGSKEQMTWTHDEQTRSAGGFPGGVDGAAAQGQLACPLRPAAYATDTKIAFTHDPTLSPPSRRRKFLATRHPRRLWPDGRRRRGG
jgi:hypothetical protein